MQLHPGWHHSIPSITFEAGTYAALFVCLCPSHEHCPANPPALRGRAPSSWSLVSSRSLRACSSYHLSTSSSALSWSLHLALFLQSQNLTCPSFQFWRNSTTSLCEADERTTHPPTRPPLDIFTPATHIEQVSSVEASLSRSSRWPQRPSTKRRTRLLLP